MALISGTSTLAIITGASRGIGRAVAVQLAKIVGPSSTLQLIARSEEALKETVEMVKKEAKERLDVKIFPSDLSKEDDVTKLVQTLFTDIGDVSKFEHVLVVHNAASPADVSKYVRELDNMKFMQEYFFITFTSTIVLTSAVLKHVGDLAGVKKTVVNVTSLAASTPIPTLHLYCLGKAGRDIFFKVMALEEPEVRVMTYDPGFVDTAMFHQVSSTTADDRSRALNAAAASNEAIFITPEQCAEALTTALQEDKYESGATVRSYDVMGIDIDSLMK